MMSFCNVLGYYGYLEKVGYANPSQLPIYNLLAPRDRNMIAQAQQYDVVDGFNIA